MIYKIRHVTTYAHGSEASAGRCALRLLPVSSARQTVHARALKIDPKPAELAEVVDFFGNTTVLARFATATRRYRYEATARVEVHAQEPPHALLTPPHEATARAALQLRDIGGGSPVHGLFPTGHVPALDLARDYASRSLAPGRPVLDAAIDMMRRIHRDFAYDPAATDVSTPLDVVFEHRRGVCQDFAHAMIAGLRVHGVPALYVSGYLRTIPPPGRRRLVGADASHAWVSVWCGPAVGFVDLDPTNALVVGEDHVTLAKGRDYADVAPVDGVVVSAAGHALTVSVDMAPEG
jgi:transglutaminase-like putative cysteine protease